ncbi:MULTISPECIES: hypothetical protein [Enterobacter cloacae complex]|uniref:hypothetical protein n=1 Tax=Enterobacter cloacae complex TaxID=354276 RepID=UPI00226EEC85|nr:MULTISPECIES: hypothetical protein [Enterobacter cloacae complex]HCJ6256151.1 hypothetical protein [Enterobacter hormaechei subsp. xiangfangensis]HCM9431145.1 hypothetical protein [Enterobacter hormaechei subsp. steigerwaltii]ELD3228465.1 hypothetical protein [Enterobacter hormaechei]ELD3432538.1 hypothetical protein [Enterobacter hormaechei]MCY0808348.1 hypothetical protein [Enterobacter cloacae complex sp. 2022EL-00747]
MSNIDKRALREAAEKHGDDDILALLFELEAAEKRIAEQREIMRQSASDISYAIFNLTGSDLSRLQPGVVETTDPTDTALIAERNLRAAAAGKGDAS